MAETYTQQTVTTFKNSRQVEDKLDIIIEEPLAIRVNGQPYAVVMRTPGQELDHVAGFCLAEGLADSLEDVADLGFCTEEGVNVVTLSLIDSRKELVSKLLERKGFVSQTSCGLCGKEVIRDMQQVVRPLETATTFTVRHLLTCVDSFEHHQPLHYQTRAAHAALLFNSRLELLAAAEDVGRHNALDKAIGRVFRSDNLSAAVCGIMSSRLSYELVQKAARAGLEVLLGISRPTLLAVDLATSLNLTLAYVKNGELTVFSGVQRILTGCTV